ncbi:unnamed protein product [Rangifer tarandus platyrhynchus]|uniref:Uncharacterized protein n=1 Tax=Rangifer tarandus platyrhynchus TaxID=3082113 RepID=A0AC59ZSR7_RANTA
MRTEPRAVAAGPLRLRRCAARDAGTCEDVTPVDHKMVAASQPALLFLGQMPDGGVDTSCFLKSQILALCFVLTEE